MPEYLESIFIILFEIFCCDMFFSAFGNIRAESRKWLRICLFIFLAAADFICSYLPMNFIVNATFYSDSLAVNYNIQGVLIVAMGKCLLFLAVLIIQKLFKKDSFEILTDWESVFFVIFPIFTIVTIFLMISNFRYIENAEQTGILCVIAFGMTGMNLFVFYLLKTVVEKERKIRERSLFELQSENQNELYSSIAQNNFTQKRVIHEFNNHILCIDSLAKAGKYDELRQYVSKISGKMHEEVNLIDTNNAVVNAILNTKYHEAYEKKIIFVMKVNDLSGLSIESEDIVIILSNLLNNAIEACEKCSGRKMIKLKFIKKDAEVIISVKNTYEKEIVRVNDEIRTTKDNREENHGIGIKNVIQTVEKYNGVYSVKFEKGIFEFVIVFFCKKSPFSAMYIDTK